MFEREGFKMYEKLNSIIRIMSIDEIDEMCVWLDDGSRLD